MRNKWVQALLGVVVTVFFLWLALRDVDFAEVVAEIRRGDMLLLGAAVLVATAGFGIRAMRWKVLLATVDPASPLGDRFSAVSIGFMVNNVLPARVGEFVRALAYSRLRPVTASAALGTLVVERILDGVVLLLFLVLPVLTPGFPEDGALSQGMGQLALRLAIGTVVVGVTLLALMTAFPRGFVRVAERIASAVLPTRWARPIVDALEAFLGSVAILRRPRLLAAALLWTLFFWSWHGVSFYLAMLAFGIDTGIVSAIFTEAIVGFGVALPSAPGFVGTFHASADFALANVYGVDPARSLAFAFGYHFGGWLPITVIGLIYAARLGLSFGEMGSASTEVERSVEAVHPRAREVLEADDPAGVASPDQPGRAPPGT